MVSEVKTATSKDVDTCAKSTTGEHVWNYTPRPDNCTLGTCRYCEQKRVFEGRLGQHVATHTAAILKPTLKPAPVKPAVLEQAARIAEKSLKQSKRGGKPKLTQEQKREIALRIKAGEKVPALIKEYGVTDETLYIIRRQLGLHGRAHHAPALTVEHGNNGHKDGSKERPKQVYNTNQGNVMSQMARLKRGEIRAASAGPVLMRYKALLEAELKATQLKAKDLKQKIEATDDALRELDVVQQGEKAVIEKVMASVR